MVNNQPSLERATIATPEASRPAPFAEIPPFQPYQRPEREMPWRERPDSDIEKMLQDIAAGKQI